MVGIDLTFVENGGHQDDAWLIAAIIASSLAAVSCQLSAHCYAFIILRSVFLMTFFTYIGLFLGSRAKEINIKDHLVVGFLQERLFFYSNLPKCLWLIEVLL